LLAEINGHARARQTAAAVTFEAGRDRNRSGS